MIEERTNALYVCRFCGSDLFIVDTRAPVTREYVRRRRICHNCKVRFTTIEIRLDEYNELLDEANELNDIRRMFEKFGKLAGKLPQELFTKNKEDKTQNGENTNSSDRTG